MITKLSALNIAAIAVVGSASLYGPAAVAADGGFYVGGNAGRSTVDYGQGNLDGAITSAVNGSGLGTLTSLSSGLDRNDTVWSVDAGYRFNSNLALEAAYYDLGKLSYGATGNINTNSEAGTIPITIGASIKSSGPALAAVGMLPFAGNWEFDVRAGVYFGRTEAKATASAGGVSQSLSKSKDNSNWMAGFGFGYTLRDHWTIRLDYLYFNSVGDDSIAGTANVDLLTAGVAYRF
jgi:OOP family OmpA-OmpF porin